VKLIAYVFALFSVQVEREEVAVTVQDEIGTSTPGD